LFIFALERLMLDVCMDPHVIVGLDPI